MGLPRFLRSKPFEKWGLDDRGQLLVAGGVRMIAIALAYLASPDGVCNCAVETLEIRNAKIY
ncbi:hypothetical protein JF66_22045 [Cryobacterium sp. MLB-32]|nr:hypothetical protein JF66_22045 [Cryobacterium sp. MLB-32]